MTDADADQLAAWLDALTPRQLGALWRWVTRYYMWRLSPEGRRQYP
jgi:hypothetical protein